MTYWGNKHDKSGTTIRSGVNRDSNDQQSHGDLSKKNCKHMRFYTVIIFNKEWDFANKPRESQFDSFYPGSSCGLSLLCWVKWGDGKVVGGSFVNLSQWGLVGPRWKRRGWCTRRCWCRIPGFYCCKGDSAERICLNTTVNLHCQCRWNLQHWGRLQSNMSISWRNIADRTAKHVACHSEGSKVDAEAVKYVHGSYLARLPCHNGVFHGFPFQMGPGNGQTWINWWISLFPSVLHGSCQVRFPLSAMNANLGNLARGCSYLVIVAMVAGAALALFWKWAEWWIDWFCVTWFRQRKWKVREC